MRLHLNTIFRWCNDIENMRHFYSDCLSLEETFFKNNNEHGWLTYQLSEIQLVFTRSEEPLPEPTAFAMNPAYRDGQTYDSSWVIEVAPSNFDNIVAKIRRSGAPIYNDAPFSNRPGHRQLIVRDPMGMTIEIYAQENSEED